MGRGGFTEEDRKTLESACLKMNKVSDAFDTFQTLLKKALIVIDNQAKHICYLNNQLNLVNYRADALNQYGRKEILGVKGLNPSVHGEDAEKIMFDIVKEIEENAKDKEGEAVNIGMTTEHIQRCHFLGEDKKRLVCKFIPYRIRMKILLNKRIINGATRGKFKNVFISENLTPLRARLLWFMKKKCTTKFTKVHTRDGVIKAKKEGADSSTDPWLSVRTPDDLFTHLDEGDEFDLEEFNKDYY